LLRNNNGYLYLKQSCGGGPLKVVLIRLLQIIKGTQERYEIEFEQVEIDASHVPKKRALKFLSNLVKLKKDM
jgi:hypothetical protein